MSFEDFNQNLINDLRAHAGKATSGPFEGRDVLILTTKGAKSGKARENPLAYTRDSENLVVVASKGGAPTHPAWYRNLSEHPDVELQVEDEVFPARARTAAGEERERLWRTMTAIWPRYDQYAEKTDREIPVVVLEPVR